MYKLYYYPRNASWAPHLILKDLGLDYKLELVDRKTDAQKSEDYLKLNPTGRIPTLVTDNHVICESAAIALYLCEQHPEGNLLPPLGTIERSLCYQWLFYLTSTLQPELMLYFYPDKHTTNHSLSRSIIEAQEDRVAGMLSILNDQIGHRYYLVGHSISICDYFLFMLCHWASHFKKQPLTFTNLARCLKNLASMETFKAVCALEKTNIDIYK